MHFAARSTHIALRKELLRALLTMCSSEYPGLSSGSFSCLAPGSIAGANQTLTHLRVTEQHKKESGRDLEALHVCVCAHRFLLPSPGSAACQPARYLHSP